MIKLDVQPYCHNCPRFEVEVISDNYIIPDRHGGYERNRTIRCKNYEVCKGMYNYINSEINNGKNKS